MAATAFQVLGPFAVLVDGEPVELPSRKQRALLALLALSPGQVLSVDRLVDELWGERPPATARHALQVHVSQLRKLLGATLLATERPGYVLRVPAEACDAHRFELLAAQGRRELRAGRASEASALLDQALQVWRGPALADLLAEPFAAQEAARLEELRLVVAEDRLTADLDLGRHTELVGELEALVARHPLRERLWGLLMLATYRAGRQVEALRAYTSLRERLRDDLGLDPGPELQQLEAAILRQDPSLAAPARSTVPTPEPDQDADEAAEPRPVAVTAPPRESRRVATVVAAVLTGFDEVARALDPEDLSVLLERCVGQLVDVVEGYGGTVEHAAGGELTAVFGAPVAHEDDPERAVRAAVDLCTLVQGQPADFAGLTLRVGVSTGEVLLAESGPPGHRRLAVVGDVVHQARRLQSADEAVVVSAATCAATLGAIDYRQLEDGASAVVRIAPVKPARPLGKAPFVGRDGEMVLLTGVWSRTVSGRRPHLVSVLGEPGVGKSRQVAELQSAILGQGRILTGRCLAYGQALSYAPLAEVLRQAAGATADEPPAVAREKLGSLVSSLHPWGLDAPDVARHLALLTGLDDAADREAGLVDERTLHVSARRFLEALARQQPLCVVLDDVHWADDALLDLVQALARRLRDVPVLIVTLARPELVERRPDWGGGLASFVSLPLQPLPASSIRALVDELGRAHGLPEDRLVDITETSGGNPLFAEELVATVAEGDAAAGVPASLASLLLARLDALPREQQQTLRHASVLGMTFWPGAVEALNATSPVADDVDLLDTIADLEQRDLLRLEHSSSLPSHPAWSFKHVLVRDAAYASLPRRQRTRLHAVAAAWLSDASADRVGDFADQLVHHALAADQPDLALEHLLAAAERARRAAAHRREAALLAEALEIGRSLDRAELVAELHGQRGRALSRLALWAEARTELEAALAGLPEVSAEALRRRAEVHCDLSAACFWLLDTDAIREHALAALDIGRRIGAHDVQLAARAQVTSADSATGDVEQVLAEGRSLISDATAWGVPAPYERLGGYSLQLYLTGNGESAIEVADAAVRTGRSAGDTHGVLWNMPHIGMAAAAAGRYDEALAVFTEARAFGEEYELLAGLPRCIAMSAGFHLDLFDFAGAEEIQEEARDLGRSWFNPSAVSAGVDLLFNLTRRGDVGRAERLVGSVGEEVMSGGGWHGWLWRLRFTQLQAELAAARGDGEAAMEHARDALAQSRAKKRTKYETYARVTLGQQLAAAGRVEEGLAQLSKATALASSLGNPALHVLAGGALLSVEPDAATARACAAAVDQVLASLSDPTMRKRFLQARPVGTIGSLTTGQG